MRIALVVDDEPLMCRVFERCLSEFGFRVLSCFNEMSVAATLKSEPVIDLLITDVMLLGTTGMRVAAMITAKFPGVPVIYTSGYASTDVKAIVKDDKCFVLSKPFTPDELLDMVTDALDVLKK